MGAILSSKQAFRFPVIVLISTALFGVAIFVFHLFGRVVPANKPCMRYCALGVFIAGVALLGLQGARNHLLFLKKFAIIATARILSRGLFNHNPYAIQSRGSGDHSKE